MKRFHVHVGVRNLDDSIRFYTGLFGAEPTVRKADYAKWMIEDPRINFAISQREGRVGINHLGLQADSTDELASIRAQFAAADASVVDEPGANCCYARSDKHWVADPQGIAWEGYRTLGDIAYFDGEARMRRRTRARDRARRRLATDGRPTRRAAAARPKPRRRPRRAAPAARDSGVRRGNR